MKTPKGFFTYFHHEAVLRALTDRDAGRLYKDLLHYGNTGELPDYGDNTGLNVAFTLFRTEIDYNFDRYREICDARSEAGKKSAQAKKEKAKTASSEHSDIKRLETFSAEELMRDYYRTHSR